MFQQNLTPVRLDVEAEGGFAQVVLVDVGVVVREDGQFHRVTSQGKGLRFSGKVGTIEKISWKSNERRGL